MHDLAASFVLGYHGCSAETAEKLLNNEPFIESDNEYDWLGSGVYFWEANPDRALAWARETASRKEKIGEKFVPAVVGAVIDLGYCLDLITDNGITAVEAAYRDLKASLEQIGSQLPVNSVGEDLRSRKLDRAVINYLHASRKRTNLDMFDTVRGIFTEGERIYPNAGFKRKTHIQICVRNHDVIKGVFRVPDRHFSDISLS